MHVNALTEPGTTKELETYPRDLFELGHQVEVAFEVTDPHSAAEKIQRLDTGYV